MQMIYAVVLLPLLKQNNIILYEAGGFFLNCHLLKTKFLKCHTLKIIDTNATLLVHDPLLRDPPPKFNTLSPYRMAFLSFQQFFFPFTCQPFEMAFLTSFLILKIDK
jgi:hypothetical protein